VSGHEEVFAMKVILRELPYGTTEEELRRLFDPYGDPVSIELPVDHITGQPTGTAIVEMATPAEAEDAVRHLRHQLFRGHRLRMRLAKPSELADEAPLLPIDEERPPETRPEAPPHRPETSPGTRARRAGL
jgi:RNA recognition motif-containing protein